MTTSTEKELIKRIAGELKKVETFAEVSDEYLEWLAGLAEEHTYAAGEVIFQEGLQIEFMLVVLEGEFVARQESLGPDGAVFNFKAGAVTGRLPYSRMKKSFVTSRAITRLRVLQFHSRYFADILHRIPLLGERLVGLLTDRVREFTRGEQQRDKLAALGKLSAGLAHELNNPAAAAARSAEALLDCLERLRRLERDPTLNEADCNQISQLELAIRSELKPAVFKDELERSDREEVISAWLQGRGVVDPWKLAPQLVEINVEVKHLQRLEEVAGKAFPSEVLRVATMLEMEMIAQQIGQSTKRISGLVKAIKEYSYMDQSPVQAVDIVQGIETTLTILEHKLRKGITVKREFAPGLPRVPANGSELNQVWTNLIDNAADAMKNKGVLTIRTALDGEFVVVEIGDNGAGIPKDVLSHIFEPFYTTKGVGEGTGLGLDAVRRIVRKLQGTIAVTSVPGDTKFQVRIPTVGLVL